MSSSCACLSWHGRRSYASRAWPSSAVARIRPWRGTRVAHGNTRAGHHRLCADWWPDDSISLSVNRSIYICCRRHRRSNRIGCSSGWTAGAQPKDTQTRNESNLRHCNIISMPTALVSYTCIWFALTYIRPKLLLTICLLSCSRRCFSSWMDGRITYYSQTAVGQPRPDHVSIDRCETAGFFFPKELLDPQIPPLFFILCFIILFLRFQKYSRLHR